MFQRILNLDLYSLSTTVQTDCVQILHMTGLKLFAIAWYRILETGIFIIFIATIRQRFTTITGPTCRYFYQIWTTKTFQGVRYIRNYVFFFGL